MARLTRTQKYAELRERMAHDSELSTLTPELSKYDQKLNELDELFKQTAAPSKSDVSLNNNMDYLGILNDIKIDPIPTPVIKEEEKVEEVKEPEEVKPVEEPDTIEKVAEDKAAKVLSIEEMVENMVAEVEKEIRSIAPVEARPTNTLNVETVEVIKNEETPVAVEEPTEEVKEEIEEIVSPVQEETVAIEEPVVEETVETVEEPTVEETKEEPVVEETSVKEEIIEEPEVVNAPVYDSEYAGIEDRSNTIISVMDPSLKPEPVVEEKVETPVEEAPVQEEVKEVAEEQMVEEPVVEETKEEPIEVNIDEPIVIDTTTVEEEKIEVPSQTAELETPEVKDVIDDAFINSAIEEVKNYNIEKGNETIDTLPGTIIEKTRHAEVEIPEDEEEKDVANTISMELKNVLNSLNDEVQKEPEVEETKTIEKVAEFVAPKEEPVVEEHKAIAKALEEPEQDVVEIKNITETLKIRPQVDSNVLDDTIPFDVAGEEEVDEDDLPSKTLNIILGVLIGVLVLVLLVIIYYILVARGILG